MGRKRNHDAQVSARSRGDSWTGRSEEKGISDEWTGHKMHCYRKTESMHLIHGTNNSTGTKLVYCTPGFQPDVFLLMPC